MGLAHFDSESNWAKESRWVGTTQLNRKLMGTMLQAFDLIRVHQQLNLTIKKKNITSAKLVTKSTEVIDRLTLTITDLGSV